MFSIYIWFSMVLVVHSRHGARLEASATPESVVPQTYSPTLRGLFAISREILEKWARTMRRYITGISDYSCIILTLIDNRAAVRKFCVFQFLFSAFIMSKLIFFSSSFRYYDDYYDCNIESIYPAKELYYPRALFSWSDKRNFISFSKKAR